jgi:hypothetical protein
MGVFTLLLEEVIDDAHLHVISFGRKHQQRLVQSLPAVTGNGAIVAARVEPALYPEHAPTVQVSAQRGVGNRLYET